MKNVILVYLLFQLSGCFMGIETKDNYHMTGWPPTVKRLAERCGGGSSYVDPFHKKEIYK